MTPRVFLGALEIAAAFVGGRVSGSMIGTTLEKIASTNRSGVRATVRIVRITIVYLAIVTMTWTLALSNLRFLDQVAVVGLAALVGGGALRRRAR